MELRGKNRIPVSNYYDRERNTSSVSEGVLYNALLLGGRYEKGFEMCKGFDDDDMDWYLMNQAYVLMGKCRESFALCNNKSVDRYDADKIKALTIPYMIYLLGMKYGGGKADSLKDIKFGWRASFESPWSANDKNDIMNSFIDVTEKNAGTVAGTIKDEEAAGYLKWCKKEVSKRVDDIVGNKCTVSYYIAANLLVTMNELLNISNMGELTDGLLAYYYKKYSR